MERTLTADAVVQPTTFSFDGTTSDLAQQFYRRNKAGDVADSLSLRNPTLPDAIQQRLKANDILFTELSGLLQRALIWDSGYVLTTQKDLVRVQTLDGVSMAEIAVSRDDYINTAKCTAQNCTQPDGLVWYKSNECNGKQMNGVSRCLVDDFTDGGNVKLSMWATGGNDTLIPEMVLRRHKWEEGVNAYEVAAIHTAPEGAEQPYGSCGLYGEEDANSVGSIIIACYPETKISAEMKAQMKAPQPGSIVTQWLKEFSAERKATEASQAPENAGSGSGNAGADEPSKKSFNMVLLVPIILGVLVVLGLVFWLCRRKKRSAADGTDPVIPVAKGRVEYASMASPAVVGYGDSTMHSGTGTGTNSSGGRLTGGLPLGLDDYDSGSSNSVMKILLSDANLVERRLAFEQIEFSRLLSKGAYGEVWVCHYEGEVVAVKRLLQNKQHSFEEVEDFTREIQLSASLSHPNIVSFIGVAWNNLENLVMVMEYLPSGDLQTYLRKNGDLLSWPREKIHMAHGMASALVYMHARSPVLIHRDLKSKNVLLSNNLETKLIDFGVSRGKKDLTMTAGVGTPFWTAPEVLEGTRYTEKSDIYSFGVLLTELDTCKIPYHDATGPDGDKLKHFQILNSVMAGSLRPSCSPECPARVKKAVTACLQHDPAKRPTATELARILDGQ